MFPQPPASPGCPPPDDRYDPRIPLVPPGLVRRASPVLGPLLERWDGLAVGLLDVEPADRRRCLVLKVIGRKFRGQVYPRVYLPARCVWLVDFLKRCFERDGRKFPKKRSILLHYVVWYLAGRPAPLGWEIHHLDGNHWNNRLENLALMTKGEHLAHHQRFPRLPDDPAVQRTGPKAEVLQPSTLLVEFETRYYVQVKAPNGRPEKWRKGRHNSRNDWIRDHLREQGWRPARVENAINVLAALVKAGNAGLRSTREAARGIGLSLPSLRGHLMALHALGYVDRVGGVFRPSDGLLGALQVALRARKK